MPHTVTVGSDTFTFPDEMSDIEIKQAMDHHFSSQAVATSPLSKFQAPKPLLPPSQLPPSSGLQDVPTVHPAQAPPPQPKPSLWERINTGIVPSGSMEYGLEQATRNPDEPPQANQPSVQQIATGQGLPTSPVSDQLSSFTSPLSIGLAAAGPAMGKAAQALPRVGRAVSRGAGAFFGAQAATGAVERGIDIYDLVQQTDAAEAAGDHAKATELQQQAVQQGMAMGLDASMGYVGIKHALGPKAPIGEGFRRQPLFGRQPSENHIVQAHNPNLTAEEIRGKNGLLDMVNAASEVPNKSTGQPLGKPVDQPTYQRNIAQAFDTNMTEQAGFTDPTDPVVTPGAYNAILQDVMNRLNIIDPADRASAQAYVQNHLFTPGQDPTLGDIRGRGTEASHHVSSMEHQNTMAGLASADRPTLAAEKAIRDATVKYYLDNIESQGSGASAAVQESRRRTRILLEGQTAADKADASARKQQTAPRNPLFSRRPLAAAPNPINDNIKAAFANWGSRAEPIQGLVNQDYEGAGQEGPLQMGTHGPMSSVVNPNDVPTVRVNGQDVPRTEPVQTISEQPPIDIAMPPKPGDPTAVTGPINPATRVEGHRVQSPQSQNLNTIDIIDKDGTVHNIEIPRSGQIDLRETSQSAMEAKGNLLPSGSPIPPERQLPKGTITELPATTAPSAVGWPAEGQAETGTPRPPEVGRQAPMPDVSQEVRNPGDAGVRPPAEPTPAQTVQPIRQPPPSEREQFLDEQHRQGGYSEGPGRFRGRVPLPGREGERGSFSNRPATESPTSRFVRSIKESVQGAKQSLIDAGERLVAGGARELQPSELRGTTTTDPRGSAFVTEDGKIVGGSDIHAEMLKRGGLLPKGLDDYYEPIKQALAKNKLVRVWAGGKLGGQEISIEAHGPVSDAQMQSLEKLAKANPRATVTYDFFKDGKRVGGGGGRSIDHFMEDAFRYNDGEPLLTPRELHPVEVGKLQFGPGEQPGPAFKSLTPEEQEQVTNRGVYKRMEETFAGAPKTQDYVSMALRGATGAKWYTRSAEAIRAYVGQEDAPLFARVLATMSPQQPVIQSMRMTAEIWHNWNEAGRPTDVKAIRKIVKQTDGLPSRILPTIRALTGDPNVFGNRAFKTTNFNKNLVGLHDFVTNDTWMIRMGEALGNKQLSMSSKSDYLAMTAKVRSALTKLPGWQADEVQAAVWSFVKPVWEAIAAGTPPEQAFETVQSHEAKGVDDFLDMFRSDKYVRQKLDAVLKSKGSSLEAVERGLAEFTPKPEPPETPATGSRFSRQFKSGLAKNARATADPPPF